MTTIQIVNKSSYSLKYATEDSAGFDVHANIETPISLESLERVLIPTGIFMQLPIGCEAMVRPRSGLSLKHGITILNTPGTIDADYRGEVGIIVVNLSNDKYTINPGDRIAQIVINRYIKADFQFVESLDRTDRGEGGFGHTGQ